MYFHLGMCGKLYFLFLVHRDDNNLHYCSSLVAVNCYTQWWSGICKQMNFTLDQQYDLALQKASKFNFIFVVEKFKDPAYIEAVEQVFNVSWHTDEERVSPFCEKQSHKANQQYPLVVSNIRKRMELLKCMKTHMPAWSHWLTLIAELCSRLITGRYLPWLWF